MADYHTFYHKFSMMGMVYVFKIDPQFLADLVGKDIMACGTGNVGKIVVAMPRCILPIGCDCAGNGHFDGATFERYPRGIPLRLEEYQRLKVFATQLCPDTEIISINPVGLRSMLHDVYTEEYLNIHPEIDRSEYEILNWDDFKEAAC